MAHRLGPTGRWLAVGATVLGLIFLWSRLSMREPVTEPERETIPVAETSPAEAVATPVDASPITSQTCAECHPNEYASYRLTGHSRSFSEVQLDQEPAPGGFVHPASRRRYEVQHRDGNLVHREMLAGAETLVAVEHVARYLVGSGRHTRTYLIEDDGFLAESPITWYASRQAWDLSPSFDKANPGFERAADVGCLFCHVGHVNVLGGSDTRLEIRDPAIGCDRCHGDGTEHVRRRRAESRRDSAPTTSPESPPQDDSIVLPTRLPRRLMEAICTNCHRTGDAMILARGKRTTDYQPGSPLSNYRVDFHFATASAEMKVTGHVEQMQRSKCYQKSETLSCVTCHDLHGSRPEGARGIQQRAKCLECHTSTACGLPADAPQRRESQDNCIACHMPTTETDIPHVAFTHHRIAIHAAATAGPVPPAAAGAVPPVHRKSGNTEDDIPALVPYSVLTQWSQVERERFLGLAYYEVLGSVDEEAVKRIYRGRAGGLLEQLRQAGSADGEVLAALAKLYWDEQSPQSLEIARQALSQDRLSWQSRQTALLILAAGHSRQNQPDVALGHLEQLIRLRRHSDDWTLLGVNRARVGDLPGGIEALRHAVQIQPFREDTRRLLAELLEQTNDVAGAREQTAVAETLARAQQR